MPRFYQLLSLCLLVLITACSTTGKSPLSGKEYKVQVGGSQNMDEYNHAREHALKQSNREEGRVEDCGARKCPDNTQMPGME